MNYYHLTDTFTLIPEFVYTTANAKNALSNLIKEDTLYEYKSVKIPEYSAVIAYAVEKEILSNIQSSDKIYPFILLLINEVKNNPNYNKLIFHYSNENKLCNIVICTGEELKLVNSFSADCFDSALYFLFLSIKQMVINPKQSIVRVCNTITEEQKEIICKYFNGVEEVELNNNII